jgi:uncharacterized protein YbjQ (UPF0145 family)
MRDRMETRATPQRVFSLLYYSLSIHTKNMLLSTTSLLEGKKVLSYKGVVTGETIFGANIVKDIFASIRDIVGGRSRTYEQTITDARETSLKEMEAKATGLGANAVIGIDIDYETIGNMIMVTVSGTAVVVE